MADAEIRQSSYEDQTESANTVSMLPEHPMKSVIKDAAVSVSLTLNTTQSSKSRDVITSKKKEDSSFTKPKDQPRYKHSQHPKCPYSLRSHRQKDGQINHTQENSGQI